MFMYHHACPECNCEEYFFTDSYEDDNYYMGLPAEVECGHCGHTFVTQRNS